MGMLVCFAPPPKKGDTFILSKAVLPYFRSVISFNKVSSPGSIVPAIFFLDSLSIV